MPKDQTTGDAASSDQSSISQMKQQIAEELRGAELALDAALVALKAVISSEQREALETLQDQWIKYRDALSEYARAEFRDGTNSGLAAATVALAETQRRTCDVLLNVEQCREL